MITDIILIIWMHFLADFILQSNWMAQNKSKANFPLFVHTVVYTGIFLLLDPIYAIVNGVAHFVTDWITSRWSKYYWGKGNVHNFFVVIGFDQAMHMTTLILTYIWILT